MNKLQKFLKEKNLPYCLHKWELVNYKETRKGYRAIYKCSRCGEYLT